TDRAGVARLKDYLLYLDREARPRYEAGLSPLEAALDIPLGDYADWGEAERVVVNVETLFRGYSGGERRGAAELFAAMAELERRRGSAAARPA
ncbi:MAG TPA: MBL fold metallo-hydrolase, partial [Candidatus Dormibacteraeota bacterium]|nr:MBL fold metallo-hydrolase [Candidatus Dormibacteraeota bacterium]